LKEKLAPLQDEYCGMFTKVAVMSYIILHGCSIEGASEVAETDNQEILVLLKSIDKRLENIYYHLADIRREMPKVPYYGDLLQDITKAIEKSV